MSTLWTPGGERPVPQGDPQPPGPSSPPPPAADRPPSGPPASEEELSPEQQAELEAELAEIQENLARAPAAAVVANHAVGLFQLAALHLNQRPPKLDEGRLAIDALAGMLQGVSGRLGESEQGLRDGLAQLQMAFVQISGETDQPD